MNRQHKARRRIKAVVLLLGVLLLLAFIFNPNEIHLLLLRLLPLAPLLVLMLVAGYLSLRTGRDTRRGRRWGAIGFALGSIYIVAHLGLQHVLEGIEPVHLYLAILPVAFALAALWYWITAAGLPEETTREH